MAKRDINATTDRRNFLTTALFTSVAVSVPAFAGTASGFEVEVQKYREMKARLDAHAGFNERDGHPLYLEAADLCRAVQRQLEHIAEFPAPNVAAIATKLELILADYEYDSLPEHMIEAVARDARLMAGRA